ncbi:MAG: uracil-DNA glycosylase family protein [Halioglobus sp.]
MSIIATDVVIEHFREVVGCSKCDQWISKKLLRDSNENIAQPGWVGNNYEEHRVLLVGQNPGVPPANMQARDAIYTAALRQLESSSSRADYEHLYKVLKSFVPEWPVQRNYFPLSESGLGLEDIAYCNVVRCRTVGNAAPSNAIVQNCLGHFDSFAQAVQPKVVIFIGKWAHDRAANRLGEIPYAFMNRMRSLSGIERRENRSSVINLVRNVIEREI